jgi:phosphotransferase system HPr (HPr) family protein
MDRSAGGPARARVRIVNTRGLHARAAAKFVKTAEAFDARVEVTAPSAPRPVRPSPP